MMHYWQEVLKVMGITGGNPSSKIKDSQIRGRSPSIWELFFLLRGLKPVFGIFFGGVTFWGLMVGPCESQLKMELLC